MNNFDNVYANFQREEKQKQRERQREEKKRETERALRNGELVIADCFELFCKKCFDPTRSSYCEGEDYTFSKMPPLLCNRCSMPFLPIQFQMCVPSGKKRDDSNMYMLAAGRANR
jgi:hypothetical protein